MEEIVYTNTSVKLCGKRKRDVYEQMSVYGQTDTIKTLENGVKSLFIYEENTQEKKVAKTE